MTDFYMPEGIPDTPLGRYVRLVTPVRSEQPNQWKAQGAYPQEFREQAATLFNQGRTADEVAAHLGVHHSTVKLWLRQMGLNKRKQKYTPEQKAEAIRLTDEGMSASEAGKRLGIPRDTIHWWRHNR